MVGSFGDVPVLVRVPKVGMWKFSWHFESVLAR